MHLACKTPMNHPSGVSLDFSLFMSCPGQPRLGDRGVAALTAHWGEGENEEWIQKRCISPNTWEDFRVSSLPVHSWAMLKHRVGGAVSPVADSVYHAPGGRGRGVHQSPPSRDHRMFIYLLFTLRSRFLPEIRIFQQKHHVSHRDHFMLVSIHS